MIWFNSSQNNTSWNSRHQYLLCLWRDFKQIAVWSLSAFVYSEHYCQLVVLYSLSHHLFHDYMTFLFRKYIILVLFTLTVRVIHGLLRFSWMYGDQKIVLVCRRLSSNFVFMLLSRVSVRLHDQIKTWHPNNTTRCISFYIFYSSINNASNSRQSVEEQGRAINIV